MTIAIDINHADAAAQVYTNQRNDLYIKMFGDKPQKLAELDKAVAAEVDADAKKKKAAEADALRAEVVALTQTYNVETVRMLSAPAGAQLSPIKESELCMASEPVAPCKVTNAIPPGILSPLVPVTLTGQ